MCTISFSWWFLLFQYPESITVCNFWACLTKSKLLGSFLATDSKCLYYDLLNTFISYDMLLHRAGKSMPHHQIVPGLLREAAFWYHYLLVAAFFVRTVNEPTSSLNGSFIKFARVSGCKNVGRQYKNGSPSARIGPRNWYSICQDNLRKFRSWKIRVNTLKIKSLIKSNIFSNESLGNPSKYSSMLFSSSMSWNTWQT